MANYSAAMAVHESLTANEVDCVTLTDAGTGYGLTEPAVTVVNRTGAADIYFTVNTTGEPQDDPTVAGDDTYVVPAAISSVSVPASLGVNGSVSVKLISTGAEAYSVVAGGPVVVY